MLIVGDQVTFELLKTLIFISNPLVPSTYSISQKCLAVIQNMYTKLLIQKHAMWSVSLEIWG